MFPKLLRRRNNEWEQNNDLFVSEQAFVQAQIPQSLEPRRKSGAFFGNACRKPLRRDNGLTAQITPDRSIDLQSQPPERTVIDRSAFIGLDRLGDHTCFCL